MARSRQPTAPAVVGDDDAPDSPDLTTDEAMAALAAADKRISKLVTMVADIGARLFCAEVMDGHRSSLKPTMFNFRNGVSQSTYEHVRDEIRALLES